MKLKKFFIFKFYLNSFFFFWIYIFRRQFLSSEEKSVYSFFLSLSRNNFINKESKHLSEFKIFPKKSTKIFPFSNSNKNVSIIIHGDIHDFDFVQSTVHWYKKCGIENIIVSTNEIEEKLNSAITIVNGKEIVKGISNENNEILNIKAALDFIPSNHLIIKTKTEQRVFNELTISGLQSIHNSYFSQLSKNNKRLGIISSQNSIFQINQIPDDIYIGDLEQMKNIFSIDIRNKDLYLKDLNIDSKNFKKYFFGNNEPFKYESIFLSELNKEQRFFNSFKKNCLLKNMSDKKIIKKKEYLKSLSCYIDIVADCLYVMDPQEIDLYTFNKKKYLNIAKTNYKNVNSSFNLSRLNWLALVHDPEYKNKIISYASKNLLLS